MELRGIRPETSWKATKVIFLECCVAQEMLDLISRLFPNLQTFIIDDYQPRIDSHYSRVTKKINKDSSSNDEKFKNLNELIIKSPLIHNGINLTMLNFFQNSPLTNFESHYFNDVLIEFIVSHWPQLRSLNLGLGDHRDFQITESCMKKLAQLKELQSFQICFRYDKPPDYPAYEGSAISYCLKHWAKIKSVALIGNISSARILEIIEIMKQKANFEKSQIFTLNLCSHSNFANSLPKNLSIKTPFRQTIETNQINILK